MTEPIRTPAEMIEQARAHLATVDAITSGRLARAIEIGNPFAEKMLVQFEAEGLIGSADRHFRHNVRSASGELAPIVGRPRRSWEEVALDFVERFARRLRKDV